MATIESTFKLGIKFNPNLSKVNRDISQSVKQVTALNKQIGHLDNASRGLNLGYPFASTQPLIHNATQDLKDTVKATSDALSTTSMTLASINNSIKLVQTMEESLWNWFAPFDKILNALNSIEALWRKINSFAENADKVIHTRYNVELMNNQFQSDDQLQNRLMRSALALRMDYGDVAHGAAYAFSTIGNYLDNSSQAAIDFHELLIQAFRVGGMDIGSSISAANKMIDVLQDGVITLEEIAGAPEIFQVLSKCIPAADKSLQEMAKNGELTVSAVTEAMFGYSNQIQKQFLEIPWSFGEALNLLKGSAMNAAIPIILQLSKFLSSEKGQKFIWDFAQSISEIAYRIAAMVQGIISLGIYVYHLWKNVIQPWLDDMLPGFIDTKDVFTALIVSAIVLAVEVSTLLTLFFALVAAIFFLPLAPFALVTGLVVALAFKANQLKEKIIQVGQSIRNLAEDIWFCFRTALLILQHFQLSAVSAIVHIVSLLGNQIEYVINQCLNTIMSKINSIISIINSMIAKVNEFTPFNLETLPTIDYEFDVSIKPYADQLEEALENSLAMVEKNQAALSAEWETKKESRNQAPKGESLYGQDEDWSRFFPEEAYELYIDSEDNPSEQYWGRSPDINHVNSLGRIDDDVTIAEEDLKLLKDLAGREYQLLYTQLTPQQNNYFGDIRETADVNAIIGRLVEIGNEELHSSLRFA